MKKICVLLFALVFSASMFSQDRFARIDSSLKKVAKDFPGLNQPVELSVKETSVQEFVRGIANTNNINVSIDPSITAKVTNNFTQVTVSDVFMFLCKKYDLDI